MTTPPPLPPQAKKKTVLPDIALAASAAMLILTVCMDLYIFRSDDDFSLKSHLISSLLTMLSGIMWSAALGFTIGSLITTAKTRTIPLMKTALSFIFLFFSTIGLIVYGIVYCYHLRMSL